MRKVIPGMAKAMFKVSHLALAWLMISGAVPLQAGDEIVDAPRTGSGLSRLDPRHANPDSVSTTLDDRDAVAALEGINIALIEVGDGGSYVWHRTDGGLSGMAQPTASFKGQSGQPCRHLIVMLNAIGQSSKIEGVACRTAAGLWQLEG